MSSSLEPVRMPRIEPVTSPRRLKRRNDEDAEEQGRKHSDEPPDEGEEPEDDGVHIDVLA
jgi:hypothetical protein